MIYLDMFLKGLIGVVAAGLGGLIILAIKWLFSIKKNVDSMVSNGKRRAIENQVQFQILRSHGTVNRAILEVVSQTKNNGNVKRAFRALEEADKVFNNYSDNFVQYDCKEKEK